MSVSELTLVISDKADPERDALASEWEMSGGQVLRLGRFWDPPELDASRVRPYGADSYCLVLAQKLGISLIYPSDDLILSVPERFLSRKISKQTLGEVKGLDYPVFVKPLVPKLFRSNVFGEAAELLVECKGLENDTKILISEVVSIQAEARFFLHNRRIQTYSLYEGNGNLAKAVSFVESLADAVELPVTVVVDVGLLDSGDWSIIEFNASWGSGLNGCEPKKAMVCIAAAVESCVG